jgi:hypothetical protein
VSSVTVHGRDPTGGRRRDLRLLRAAAGSLSFPA